MGIKLKWGQADNDTKKSNTPVLDLGFFEQLFRFRWQIFWRSKFKRPVKDIQSILYFKYASKILKRNLYDTCKQIRRQWQINWAEIMDHTEQLHKKRPFTVPFMATTAVICTFLGILMDSKFAELLRISLKKLPLYLKT